MTISVIIPIYNAEKTIKRSLDSILNQTISPGEILCVLNCCTDNTENIVKEYVKQHGSIKILKCDEKGIVPALNMGLYNSTGELIARQDADDFWLPNKLEKQIEFLNNNPDVDILGTQIKLVKPNTFEEISISNHPLIDLEIKKTLYSSQNAIAHPSVIFRRKILLRVSGYDDLYPLCEDMALWLKASKWFRFANLPEVLVEYTSTSNPAYTPVSPQLAAHNMNLILNYFPKI